MGNYISGYCFKKFLDTQWAYKVDGMKRKVLPSIVQVKIKEKQLDIFDKEGATLNLRVADVFYASKNFL